MLSRPPDPDEYSYLLGMYLGDGHISHPGSSYQLRIVLERAISEGGAGMRGRGAGNAARVRVHVRDRTGERVAVVEASSKAWPELIPQYGKGRKHERPIVLTSWQRAIVDGHPERFLRGLIHSDGCRTMNRFQVALPSGRIAQYAYPRYFFSNLSADIRGLFCEYCERLDIRWTQSNHRNISVSHRDSVARLDAFIGPKT